MGPVEYEVQRDACTDGPVRTLVDLAPAPEHRRGQGALPSGINLGRIDVAQLRRVPPSVPLPRAGDGRLGLAVDVPPWLRSPPARSATSSNAWWKPAGGRQPPRTSWSSSTPATTRPAPPIS
ncbi:transposase [Streptomyces sp. NPDC085540]|uniref:transposase n=1 Tax=Streptomyces sp. NPDC085540 TaxID=3365730 RepID=UPI0037D97B4B